LRQGSSSDPLARSSPDHRGAFQAALNAFVAEERALKDLGGLTGSMSLQNGFYAHLGQADWASLKRPGVKTPATPPRLVTFRRTLGRELQRNDC
jgi:hypothetical protein